MCSRELHHIHLTLQNTKNDLRNKFLKKVEQMIEKFYNEDNHSTQWGSPIFTNFYFQILNDKELVEFLEYVLTIFTQVTIADIHSDNVDELMRKIYYDGNENRTHNELSVLLRDLRKICNHPSCAITATKSAIL